MPLLDNCCRCCTLRTGTIVTGVLGILLGLSGLITVLSVEKLQVKTIVIDTLPDLAVRIILAVNLVMTIFISSLLIFGAVKRNRWCMLPFVVLALMLAIGLLISVLYTSVEHYVKKDPILGSIWLIFGLISVVVYVYLWCVVFSYYQLVREERGRGPYGKTPYPQPR